MSSGIEWTQETWNPTAGCSRISPGCGGAARVGGCYAERQAIRLSAPGRKYHGLVRTGPQGPRWTGKVVLDRDALEAPLAWRAPRLIFVNSMSDLFHEALDDEDIAEVFAVMGFVRRHTYQVLTKRDERMRELLGRDAFKCMVRDAINRRCKATRATWRWPEDEVPSPPYLWPLPNVWMGVSVETDDYVSRIVNLRQTPAAVRFGSLEPLLSEPRQILQWIDGLDWVIAGGESGPGARPCQLQWLASIAYEAHRVGVPCFIKQLGARPVDEGTPLRLIHRKGASSGPRIFG